eukprot:1803182-Amphidinium_carterae.1
MDIVEELASLARQKLQTSATSSTLHYIACWSPFEDGILLMLTFPAAGVGRPNKISEAMDVRLSFLRSIDLSYETANR